MCKAKLFDIAKPLEGRCGDHLTFQRRQLNTAVDRVCDPFIGAKSHWHFRGVHTAEVEIPPRGETP